MNEDMTHENNNSTKYNEKPSIFDTFSNSSLGEEEILRQKHCTLHHTAQLIRNLNQRQY